MLAARAVGGLFSASLTGVRALNEIGFAYLALFRFLGQLPRMSITDITRRLSVDTPATHGTLGTLRALNVLGRVDNGRHSGICICGGCLSILRRNSRPVGWDGHFGLPAHI